MPPISTLGVFIVAALVLVVTPGPAVLYIVGEGVGGGRRAGVVAAFGIFAGGLVHVVAAAVGISAIIAASSAAFTVLKLLGAAYLVYLGVRSFRSDWQRSGLPQVGLPVSDRTRFGRGFVVNALNPKTAVFFVAFLPQFVDVGGASPQLQAAALGIVFVVIALASDLVYGVLAGSAGQALARSRRFLRLQRWASGLTLMGLGVTTAVLGRAS